MIFVLIGPQGCGKDTQGKLLEKKYSIPLFSIGQAMRESVASKSTLGNLVGSYIEKGNLVPDDVCDALLKERLSQKDCENGFILDACPRTPVQAILLEYWLWGKNLKIDKVFYINITDEEIIKRLKFRAEEAMKNGEKPRSDDLDQDAIKNRIANYKANIDIIKMYYKMKGILEEVDGMVDIESIHKDIISRI